MRGAEESPLWKNTRGPSPTILLTPLHKRSCAITRQLEISECMLLQLTPRFLLELPATGVLQNACVKHLKVRTCPGEESSGRAGHLPWSIPIRTPVPGTQSVHFCPLFGVSVILLNRQFLFNAYHWDRMR